MSQLIKSISNSQTIAFVKTYNVQYAEVCQQTQQAKEHDEPKMAKCCSATGTRTQVSCVKGKYDNHLHHSGAVGKGALFAI